MLTLLCSYFASSSNVFKRMVYKKCEELSAKTNKKKDESESSAADISSSSNKQSVMTVNSAVVDFIPAVPKMIFVILDSRRPRRMVRMLLSKRTAPSLSSVLDRLAVTLEITSLKIRKLVSTHKRVVSNRSKCSDFF